MNTAAEGTVATLVERVRNILLTPKTEWPRIRSEPATVAGIYRGYLAWLALIPAVAGFIGMSLVGVGAFGYSVRIPIGAGLAHMVLSYLLWLGSAWLLALVVDALAPTFGGRKDFLAAFKLVAYSFTAAWVGGVFSALPALGILGLVAAAYSICLLYLGLPVLMGNPPEKSPGYTVVIVICGIVVGVVVGMVASTVMGSTAGMRDMAPAAGVSIRTPEGEVQIDTAKLEAFAKKMEEAGKKMEAAQRSGDAQAVAKAGAEMTAAAATSSGGRTPVNAQELKALLPETLAGLKRESWAAEGGGGAGLSMSSARAGYRDGERHVELSIQDTGSLAGLAGLAGLLNVNSEKETQDRVERTYKQGERTVHEELDKQSRRAEYSVVLANGIIARAEGEGVDMATLKSAVEALPLGKLETAGR